ncbi:RagB/SusD family nutrient uptake outer membrane protein [Parabacteroides hominis]|uniref:RagB/SusD family nutrient uptake outer membrane protein n=1 Tax=Parabacteroides hominis TaxID=2763057 RepID=A0ABR7DKR4_9BACT|nr:RagB/SusD family nutrient uptake outer membrane protein [Parabacteroides hominis]MBC5631957.1 RagB/SusD family nutrient uptake outer membrane protein [Parabacteroides hominis]
MKLIKNICLIGVVTALLTGCRGDLMDLTPYSSISSGNMWTSENLADMGVTGIYNRLLADNVAYDLYKFECFGVSADCRDRDYALTIGNITTSDGLFSGYWSAHYEGISRCNDAIANLPNAPLSESKLNRLMAESKFLRAFFYYKLNMMYKGVPLYLEPTELDDFTKGRNTEAEVWNQIITDLTDAINTADLPDKYAAGDASYGRATKGAAYALRGKAYMWMSEWAKAEADFRKVGDLGYALFQGGYKQLFKEANEQSDEMIFSMQCIGESGYGNSFSFRYGSRVTFGSCWNTYLVSTDFVNTYECVDGKPFDWDDYIPGYNSMSASARSVYFLRDGMTDDEKTKMTDDGADLSKYLDSGNEARILAAYANRDPRLQATVITPYSQYAGANSATDYTYTLRWPYRGYDTADPFDVKTDTNNRFYYLFRKFVAEGASEIPNRTYSPIDIPIIRYADVVLSLAECLNEQGKTDEAVQWVNMVRARAGIALLNSNTYTQVTGQDNMRERIRNERRWEFAGEGVNFFDEMRWKTLHESKFHEGAGLKQIWGTIQYSYSWGGDQLYNWAIPRTEIQMNGNLKQNEGWID